MSIRLVNYYGGKYRMADTLTALAPEGCRDTYELFGGSGALTLNYDSGGEQVINEKNRDIYCLWEVVKDRRLGLEFMDKISAVEYSRNRFAEAKGHQKNGFAGLGRVDKAVEMFVLLSQSYNSRMSGYSVSDKNQKDYAEENVSNIARVYSRMEKITIRNRDAIEMAGGLCGEEGAFLFLDPPYLHEYRGKGACRAYGDYEMKREEHEELLNTIRDAKCRVMLCGYRGKGRELYDSVLGGSNVNEWKCYLLGTFLKPNGSGECAEEYIWVNYGLPPYAEYVINMGTEINCREQKALHEKGGGVTILTPDKAAQGVYPL